MLTDEIIKQVEQDMKSRGFWLQHIPDKGDGYKYRIDCKDYYMLLNDESVLHYYNKSLLNKATK